MRKISRPLLLLIPLILSGCMGVYEGGFECPPGQGVGCKSISEVNELVNQGLGQHSSKVQGNPADRCRGNHACPVDESSLEIWYVPEELSNEILRERLYDQRGSLEI